MWSTSHIHGPHTPLCVLDHKEGQRKTFYVLLAYDSLYKTHGMAVSQRDDHMESHSAGGDTIQVQRWLVVESVKSDDRSLLKMCVTSDLAISQLYVFHSMQSVDLMAKSRCRHN